MDHQPLSLTSRTTELIASSQFPNLLFQGVKRTRWYTLSLSCCGIEKSSSVRNNSDIVSNVIMNTPIVEQVTRLN
jgi:hypothetical protein